MAGPEPTPDPPREGDPNFVGPPRPVPRGDWRQMKPNPQWPDEIRYLIRGYVAAKGEKLPPCPVCGSKKRGRWTMLCPFRAYTFSTFVVKPATTAEDPLTPIVFAPLTLVCSDHPINPTDPIMEAL
jgi:hypothetical protein